jgi:hypothetical protein
MRGKKRVESESEGKSCFHTETQRAQRSKEVESDKWKVKARAKAVFTQRRRGHREKLG